MIIYNTQFMKWMASYSFSMGTMNKRKQDNQSSFVTLNHRQSRRHWRHCLLGCLSLNTNFAVFFVTAGNVSSSVWEKSDVNSSWDDQSDSLSYKSSCTLYSFSSGSSSSGLSSKWSDAHCSESYENWSINI